MSRLPAAKSVSIARKGIEAKDKLGKHRWVIERTMAWFTGYRRLTLRYEREAEHFGIAHSALGCGGATSSRSWRSLR